MPAMERRTTSDLEAARWRQVQPESRLSPRAATQRLHPAHDARNNTTAAAFHRQDSVTRHNPSSYAPQNVPAAASPPSRRSIERPLIHTQETKHHFAPTEARPERTLISPHTPSNDQWRLHSSRDGYTGISQYGSFPASKSDTSKPFLSTQEVPSARDDASAKLSMSLPSFASLQESTQYRSLDKTLPTSFAAGLSQEHKKEPHCLCDQLSAMIQNASNAAHQLTLALRDHAIPQDKDYNTRVTEPVEMLQRLVIQLVSAETELALKSTTFRQRMLCANCNASLSATDKSPLSFKRPAGQEDRHPEASKRPRVDAYDPRGSSPPRQSPARDDRRLSVSPSAHNQLELAQPVPHSGSLSSRLLPSPSSLVQPAPIPFTGSRVATSASPTTTSYQPSNSLHNASTSSVASQHIANLEHKVSLTSLSLQTLQDEHTSLLQKFHRERTKTQTIEKKCQTADSEINELSAKNDELLEQVKSIETQLLELESKRGEESRLAARDKEQWTKMLDMARRLQTAAEKRGQRLQDENARLEERVLWYEEESQARFERSVKATGGSIAAALPPRHPTATSVDSRPGSAHGEPSSPGDRSSRNLHSSARSSIETNLLRSQVDSFRLALEDAQRRSSTFEQKFKELEGERQTLAEVIDNALSNRSKAAVTDVALPLVAEAQSGAEPSTKDTIPVAVPSVPRNAAASSVEAFLKGEASTQDLGFDVPTTASSPEDLIRALGPVTKTS